MNAAGMRFRQVAFALAVVAMAAVVDGVSAAPAVVVTDVRAALHEGRTRFVLDLTQPAPFTIFTLIEPDRIVIDLPEVGWRMASRPLATNVGVLHRFRYGLFRPGTSRVVLDLKHPARVSEAFLMAPLQGGVGHRLVIDMVQTTRTAFAAGARNGRPVATPVAAVARAPTRLAARIRPPTPAPRFRPETQARVRPAGFVYLTPLPKPTLRPRQRIVVLDAGHGGIDPGAIGVSGTYEKHLTLAVARDVRDHLNRLGRYRVLMTRNSDTFVRLRDRVAVAAEAEADLFVSIHADALRDRRVRGATVHTLSERASDTLAAELAETENKADMIAGIDLSHESTEVTNILIDLARRETMNRSARMATALVRELGREVRLLRNPHRFAGFVVLKAADVPSVLVELGFLSNRRDEALLRQAGHRRRLAAAIARSVDAYFVGVEEAASH